MRPSSWELWLTLSAPQSPPHPTDVKVFQGNRGVGIDQMPLQWLPAAFILCMSSVRLCPPWVKAVYRLWGQSILPVL